MFLTIRSLDFDNPSLGNAGVARDVIDLVFLEQELDAAREFIGNLAGSADDLVPVVLDPRNLEAEVCGVVTYQRIELRVLE